jgi:NAD(P)-dependent dehydrogenase (short-subunit alcohol dehydrogenase family)
MFITRNDDKGYCPMRDPDNLAARRLLITGAAGGMGSACALLASAGGYQLVLADLSAAKLEALASRCREQAGSVECHSLDVTSADSIRELAQAVRGRGGIDALIHTVGISPQMAGWEKIIDVDLIGTTAFLEAVRPSLKAGGCALVITSMSAHMVPADAILDAALADPLAPGLMEQLRALSSPLLAHSGMAYAYAKKALKNYVADHAYAWGGEGKRLVSLSPGLIDTEMGRLENAAMDNFEGMRSLIALGRLGDPQDIASAALFLVSEAAAYITGCDILVDGGFVASFNARQRQPAAS